MKNEFAKEYFQNLKREATDAEKAMVNALEEKAALDACLNAELGDVRLPSNQDVVSAYAVASRLFGEIGEEKLTLANLFTALERRKAMLAKKKNLEVDEVPSFGITVSEDGDEATFAVAVKGGENALAEATFAVQGKRVVAGAAWGNVDSIDPVKNDVEICCAKNGNFAEIAGIPYASRVGIVRENKHGTSAAIVVGSAPTGQVSRKKMKEGDELYLLDTQKSGAYAVRAIQRLLRVQKLARPMMMLQPIGEGGLCAVLAGLGKGFDVDVSSVVKSGLLTDVATAKDGLYLTMVRGFDTEEWLGDVAEFGMNAQKIGVIGDDEMKITCDKQNLVCVDVSLVQHLASNRKLNAVIGEENAHMGAIDGLTRNYTEKGDFVNGAKAELNRLAVCSKRGAEATADSFAGEESVLLPWGGKNGLTQSNALCAITHAAGDLACLITASDNLSLTAQNPFTSAVNAIASATTKQLVAGAKLNDIKVLTATVADGATDPVSMGAKVASALGTLYALNGLGLTTCGMPNMIKGADGARTIAYGVSMIKPADVRTGVFNKEGRVYRIALPRTANGTPDFEHIKKLAAAMEEARAAEIEFTATCVSEGDSIVTTVIKSCLGSGMGFYFHKPAEKLFEQATADVLVMASDIKVFAGLGVEYVGEVQTGVSFEFGTKVLNTFGVSQNFTSHFERKFPTVATNMRGMVENHRYRSTKEMKCINPIRPRVFIPVLKGTNNEYTLSKAFRDFGAIPVVVDLTGEYNDAVREQVVDAIQKSQIIAITDGPISEEERARFVGLMCEKAIKAEVNKLMGEREGLAIGTGAGFDILNRLGMLAADEINPSKKDFDLLPGNLGRRIFTTAAVKVASTLSPWAYGLEPGEVYSVRLATDGARLSATPEVLEEMVRTGRIATQFVDADGFATMESPYNAVGADMAVEGVFSPTGRVFGRCATNERADASYVGTDSAWDMKVFEWGAKYFK